MNIADKHTNYIPTLCTTHVHLLPHTRRRLAIQQGGNANGHFAKVQAKALDSLVCQLSGWLVVPVSVQHEALTLFRLLND